MLRFLVFMLLAGHSVASSSNRTVVVTGATGRSGVLTYKALQAKGLNVRAVVRNITKARLVLNCSACDASEGIFVGSQPRPFIPDSHLLRALSGDINDAASLAPAMTGADALVSTVGCTEKCVIPFDCHFLPGEAPKEILFDGLKNQVSAKNPNPNPSKETNLNLTLAVTITLIRWQRLRTALGHPRTSDRPHRTYPSPSPSNRWPEPPQP